MKPPKLPSKVFHEAQHQSQDPVLVSIVRDADHPVVVAVEWRDGAGELHHADLCNSPNDPWCEALTISH